MTESPPPRLGARELLRQLIHVSFGFAALAVPFLGASGTMFLLAAALLWNAFLFPRFGGRRLWRREERERGVSVGMILYPAVLLALALLFRHRLEIVVAVWGVLAFGDGAATLLGRAAGRKSLPFNGEKTWTGTIAHFLFGGTAAAGLLIWTARSETVFLVVAGFAAAAFAAFLESQPQKLDDNLFVPPLVALVLWGLLESHAFWIGVTAGEIWPPLLLGLATNLVLGVLAHRLGAIDLSGLVAGVILGTAVFWALGPPGFGLLMSFVVLGTLATRFGHAEKTAGRLAEERGGRRGAKNALANTLAATLAAVFAATTSDAELWTAAFAAALAAAASDTLSSEIGQVWGGRTVDILTFRDVPRGADGAVSPFGTLAGLVGAIAVAALGAVAGLYSPVVAVVVAAAGLAGNLADSLLGAVWERRGLLDNEGVNFLATTAAAVLAGITVGMTGGMTGGIIS